MVKVAITKETLIPDVLAEFPACRAVFDRCGLHGCGGPLGPRETVGYFARVHGVDSDELLKELNAVAQNPSRNGHGASYQETPSDTLYRKFFKAAIFFTLTAGCTWGAANLFQIGLHRDFFAVPLDWTLAHAHAQIFGFVGLFVMGFAYQAFPRFRHTTLAKPRWAEASFWLMLTGIMIHTLAQTWASVPFLRPLGLMSGVMELIAVTIFLNVIIQTERQTPRHADSPIRCDARVAFTDSLIRRFADSPFFLFVITGLLMFWLQAALSPILFWSLATAPDEKTLIARVATWLVPFRDVQFIGFAMMMIFGVSLRLLPPAYGLQSSRFTFHVSRIYAVLLASFLADITCWVLMRTTGIHWFGIGLQLAYLGFLIAGALTAFTLGVFGKSADPDRSLKFVRAAYAWLMIALVMLNFMHPYNVMTGQRFSHAYFGGFRHALTVGFITMMIMGISAKIVPTLRGWDARRLNALWLPFLLINLGNALRVTTEIATDFTPAIFPLMGISGFFEVTALLLWGIDLWRTMNALPTKDTKNHEEKILAPLRG
jgi:hypothetical protein